MSPEALVTDTHPLVYYFCTGKRRLSSKAVQAFEDATVNKTCTLYVPAVTLWEISILNEGGRVRLSLPFGAWVDTLFSMHPTIIPVPLDEHTVTELDGLNFTNDLFDRAIVATAREIGLPLLTNDRAIHAAKPCALYWD